MPRIIHWAIFLNIRTFVHRQDGHQRTIPLDASGAVLGAGASWREDQEDGATTCGHSYVQLIEQEDAATMDGSPNMPWPDCSTVLTLRFFAGFSEGGNVWLSDSIPQLKERIGAAFQEITVELCQQISSRNVIANAGATWKCFILLTNFLMWKFPEWIKI